jgi:hypothetical protein
VGAESNRDAIGARVEAEADGRIQVAEVQSGGSYLSHNDMRVHFGLGAATTIEKVVVRWPGGLVEEFGPFDANQFLTLQEGNAAAP